MMHPAFANILIATDFSDCSRPGVERGQDLAAAFGANAHFFHVVSRPADDVWVAYTPADRLGEIVDRLKREAMQRLGALARADLKTGNRIVTAVAWGDPADEILKYASEHAIDLIVCGTHGRRGWNRVMMGSVAERLVRLAPCPVFTIRAGSALEAAA